MLTVLLMLIFGFKVGVKIALFVWAALLGYLFFNGALYLTFLTFLGIVSGILIFKFPLISHLYVNVGPGEIMVIFVALFFITLCIARVETSQDPFKVPLLVIFTASIISLTSSMNITVSLFMLAVMILGYALYRWMIRAKDTCVEKIFDMAFFIASLFVLLCVMHYFFSPYKVEVMEKYKSVFAGRYTFILAGPNSMAGVIATLFPIILLFVRVKPYPYRILWGTIGFLAVFVLYVTASRNGYVASALTIIAAVYFITTGKYRVVGVLGVLAVMLFLSIVIFPGIISRVTTIFRYELDISALSRFILWQQALMSFKESIITGVGVGSFFYLPMSLNMSIAHNQLLNMLAETGIMGGLGYIVLIFLIFRTLIRTYVKGRKRNSVRSIYTGSLIASWIGFVFHNIFDGIWAAPHHTKEAMFFWLLLAVTVICTRKCDDTSVTIAERERQA
jgi:O-antigen ligase